VRFDPRVVLARRLRMLPPRVFAVAAHALFQGELSTLRRPRTYSQLAAVRNLAAPDPLVSLTADKYAVRAHVADRIGEEHLVPLLQVVYGGAELDPHLLREPCVLKGTHGCEMTELLPRGADDADLARLRHVVDRWVATDFYRHGMRERSYRGLVPRVVVERFLGQGAPPPDYKFFVFHGTPAMVVVDENRFAGHTSTMLSPEWEPFAVDNRFGAAAALPSRPAGYDRMLEIAATLGKEFDFVRVDLYSVEGQVYFGELTHYPGGGLVRIRPRAFDRALGDLWRHGTPIPRRFVRPSG